MPSLNLRGLSDELMRKIKGKAALSGMGVRDYAVRVLELDVEDAGMPKRAKSMMKRIPKAAQLKAESTPREGGPFDFDVHSTPDMNDRPDIFPGPAVYKPKEESAELKVKPWLDVGEKRHLQEFTERRQRGPNSLADWQGFLKHGY